MHNLKGSIYLTIAAFFFGTYGVWSHLMGDSLGNFFQAWTRGLIITLILLIIGISKNQLRKIRKQDLPWIIIISLSGGLNQAPYFYAFKNIDIGTATLLFYASLTISTYLFGKVFFKEDITPIKLLSLCMAIFGMILIFSFSWQASFIYPAVLAVIAGLMGGSEVTFTKKVSDKYPSLTILLYIFIAMFIGNGLTSIFIHEPINYISNSTVWLAALGYTLSMIGSMYFVVEGFKYVEPSVGGIIGLSEILFAIVFGFILFNQQLTPTVITGGLIILFAVILPNLHIPKRN